MPEYLTSSDIIDKNDRIRKLNHLQQMGKAYVEDVITQIEADDRYQTEQQKQTAIDLVRSGYAIDADEAREVFLKLPRQSSNDQYQNRKRR